MEEDYYSITAILADNHKLSCTFALDVEGLGYLEGGSEPNIQEGAKVELPFWLAGTLTIHDFTTFIIPLPYSSRVKDALIASATSVKLSNLVGGNGWWYRLGKRLVDILEDALASDIRNMLLRAFAGRLPILQDLAAHHASADHTLPEISTSRGEIFRDGMEGDERELFAIGQDSGRLYKAWYDRRKGGR
ncbi:DNA replication complex GINS protein PSF3 [Cryptococcus sp. DSM 104548]